ncbi:MAG TPA: hypothetical protein VF523_00350, partial [Burkholderiales bacterium]
MRLVAFGIRVRCALVAWATATCLSLPAIADDAADPAALPSFAELEAAGAVIGDIRIVNSNIFNLDDPKEDNFLFRLANKLHIRTRSSVIQRTLLFKPGEPLSVQKIEESERLLLDNRYLYDVHIRVVGWHDGLADIEVETRDTWTIEPGFHFSRSGGSNSTGLTVREGNFLGTGTSIAYSQSSDVDRKGTEFEVSQKHLFGGWTAIDLKLAKYDDGKRQSLSLAQPFYALDTRWALGGSTLHDERIESIYSDGGIVGQYRHRQDASEVYGGWSKGLVDGWTQRYSVGLDFQQDAYAIDPTLIAPAGVPVDQTLVSPFLRYEVIEDDYEKVRNRNKIHRTEFFEVGFNSKIQVGRALTSLGSTRDLWLYSAEASDGVHTARGNDFLASAKLSGLYGDGRGEREQLGGTLQYYVPHWKRAVFYASAGAAMVKNPDPT